MATLWLNSLRQDYHMYSTVEAPLTQKRVEEAPQQETSHLQKLKEYQAALNYALVKQAKAVLFLTPSCLLSGRNARSLLNDVMAVKYGDIVAPQLLSDAKTYANYWCAMSASGDYVVSNVNDCKTHTFHDKSSRTVISAANTHSCFLLNNKKAIEALSKQMNAVLAARESRQQDVMSLVGLTAVKRGLSINVIKYKDDSDDTYGSIIESSNQFANPAESARADADQLANQLTKYYAADLYDRLKPASVFLGNQLVGNFSDDFFNLQKSNFLGPASEGGLLDDVYVINLDRRPERLKHMRLSLDAMAIFDIIHTGIPFIRLAAVDGKNLSSATVKAINTKSWNSFSRRLNPGEIGCVLSHYEVWQKIARKNNPLDYTALVLEDDARFKPFFARHLHSALADARRVQLDWDFLYVSREKTSSGPEAAVVGCNGRLVRAKMSYWANAYVLTRSGAQKFLAAEPLENMVPVDELVGILSGSNPNKQWNAHFPVKDVQAYAIEPDILKPLFYTNEPNWVSDTRH